MGQLSAQITEWICKKKGQKKKKKRKGHIGKGSNKD